VTAALDQFDALRGAQAIEELVDDLSNWYVRRSRPRFWNANDPVAHATLHEALTTIARLLAPYTPFVADVLYRNLTGSAESVHLSDWPVADRAAVDPVLEADMARARAIVSLGLSARGDAKTKVRQPLRRALVLLPDGEALSPEVTDEVAGALNVKFVEPVTDLEGLLAYAVVPNFRALGPKLGKRAPLVAAALEAIDGGAVHRAFDASGAFELALADGSVVTLGPDDVDVRAESHAELALAQEGGTAVALDLALDDELRAEGTARELIRLLNEERKALGLELADRVRVQLGADGATGAAAHLHRDWIAAEVLAVELSVAAPSGDHETNGERVLEVDGAAVTVLIERAPRA
jgi:isoleucyl-tRNA synthetase